MKTDFSVIIFSDKCKATLDRLIAGLEDGLIMKIDNEHNFGDCGAEVEQCFGLVGSMVSRLNTELF